MNNADVTKIIGETDAAVTTPIKSYLSADKILQMTAGLFVLVIVMGVGTFSAGIFIW